MSTAEHAEHAEHVELGYVVALVETHAGTWTLRLKKDGRVLHRKPRIRTLDEARRRADVYVEGLGARVVELPVERDA